ncbi:alpha amino-terminal protein methyltransferase, partial [Trifolium pratense]
VGLKPGGLFVLKENIARSVVEELWFCRAMSFCSYVSWSIVWLLFLFKLELVGGVVNCNIRRIQQHPSLISLRFVLDNEDRSVTRSDKYFRELFSRCGLHVYKAKDQKGFPDELFAVKMYALTTEIPKKVHHTRSKTKSNRPR